MMDSYSATVNRGLKTSFTAEQKQAMDSLKAFNNKTSDQDVTVMSFNRGASPFILQKPKRKFFKKDQFNRVPFTPSMAPIVQYPPTYGQTTYQHSLFNGYQMASEFQAAAQQSTAMAHGYTYGLATVVSNLVGNMATSVQPQQQQQQQQQQLQLLQFQLPHQPQQQQQQQKPRRSNPGKVSVTTSLYKTELCRSYEQYGTCRYGVTCQFAHGLIELREVERHPKYKTRFCYAFHSNGYCPYGNRCHFVHDICEKIVRDRYLRLRTRQRQN